jgi:hypothetical protein
VSLFVHDSAVAADLHGLTAVTLLRRYELNAAVAVPMVVPIDERGAPLTGLLFGCKWLAGVIRPILPAPRDFVYTVLNRDSEYGLSFETLGLEKDLSTPNSSNRLSSVAARIALPLSACRTKGCLRPLLIRSRKQALLTRSAAMAGSVTARKDDVSAADQAAMANVAG